MAWKVPKISEIAKRIQADIRSETGTGTALPRSLVIAISYAVAGVVYLLHKHLEYVIDQILPTPKMSFDFLARYASRYNVYRKPATKTMRTVESTGTPGAFLPSTAILSDDNGNQYVPTGEFQVVDGIVTAQIQALGFGTSYNIPVGSKLSLQSPVSGINSSFTVLQAGYNDGVDEESHEALLERLLEVIRTPSSGGNRKDYEIWAKEVPGVTRAWCYPTRFGIGHLGISFVTDGAASLIPTQAKVDEVQAHINEEKPVEARVTVFAPVEDPVDFLIALEPNTEEVRNSVTNALRDLFTKESIPEGRLLISHIREAVSTSLGENDHHLLEPDGDIIALNGELKTIGNINFQNMVYYE